MLGAMVACSSGPRSEIADPTPTDPVAATTSATTPPPPATSTTTSTTTRATSITGMVEAWRVGLSEPVSSRPNGSERIVMIGSTVLVVLDRSLVAYDVASGQQLWTLPLAFDGADPLLPLIVGTDVVVATDMQTLERVDLRTGRRRWQARIGGVATCSALTSPVANSSSGHGVDRHRPPCGPRCCYRPRCGFPRSATKC